MESGAIGPTPTYEDIQRHELQVERWKALFRPPEVCPMRGRVGRPPKRKAVEASMIGSGGTRWSINTSTTVTAWSLSHPVLRHSLAPALTVHERQKGLV